MLELTFQPFPVLTTERLLFRELLPTDSDQVYKLRSNPTAMQFLDKAPLTSKEEALDLISKIKNGVETNDCITWAIALKEEPDILIGTIGYWRIVKEHYRAEIGYMLLPQYFNKGYMTEAINKLNDYAFNEMNLHSIEANINPANAASEAILLKTGFIKEAYFKENYYYNGAFIDSVIFSLVKK
ncbi:MAG: GNAT family N-acetyltransferase [Rhizobacter sp.]|nr:GNAT family N-acetyltransferase [Ferruginibacter sp.]